MKLSESIKSISYLKANAAEIINTIKDKKEPYIITQNGEAKAVIQNIEEYEKTQETLAMLKLLSMSDTKNKRTKGIRETFAEIKKRINNQTKTS